MWIRGTGQIGITTDDYSFRNACAHFHIKKMNCDNVSDFINKLPVFNNDFEKTAFVISYKQKFELSITKVACSDLITRSR